MRRSKEDAAETRRQIMTAAEELFLEKDYEDVSLDQIAVTAGVTRGAVHFHFRNKQGLLFAIRDELPRPMQGLAEQLAAGTLLDPLAALREILENYCLRLQRDPRQKRILKVILQADWASPPDDGSDLQRQFRGALIKILEAAQKNAALPAPWTPKSAAIAFNAMMNGLISEWARGQTDFELVPDAIAIVRTILEAWGAPARSDGPVGADGSPRHIFGRNVKGN